MAATTVINKTKASHACLNRPCGLIVGNFVLIKSHTGIQPSGAVCFPNLLEINEASAKSSYRKKRLNLKDWF
jgi:hypothetical protein